MGFARRWNTKGDPIDSVDYATGTEDTHTVRLILKTESLRGSEPFPEGLNEVTHYRSTRGQGVGDKGTPY